MKHFKFLSILSVFFLLSSCDKDTNSVDVISVPQDLSGSYSGTYTSQYSGCEDINDDVYSGEVFWEITKNENGTYTCDESAFYDCDAILIMIPADGNLDFSQTCTTGLDANWVCSLTSVGEMEFKQETFQPSGCSFTFLAELNKQ
jgi:hypothetical protein